MKRSRQKTYNRKRPAHAAEAHTKAKRWFKKKSRKSARKHEKTNMDVKSGGNREFI